MPATAEDFPATMSIPDAGKRYFGLSKNGSYDAADRGEIPFVRVGRLRLVPIKMLEKQIEEAARKNVADAKVAAQKRREKERSVRRHR
jgi:hypothetical protein